MNQTVMVVGDSSFDVFITPSETETVCSLNDKECLICFDYGEKILVDSLFTAVGGNAANVAVGLSRLGLSVKLSTILGRDNASGEIVQTLVSEGVSTNMVIFQEAAKANYSTVINYSGERTIFTYHSPKEYVFVEPDDIPDWVYLTSMGKGFESIYAKVVKYCTDYKIPLAINPGTLQIKEQEQLLATLDKVNVLNLNKQEAEKILGVDAGAEVQFLLNSFVAKGVSVVVITDGVNGSYVSNGQSFWHCPILQRKPIERTGAGDAYSSGFLASLVSGSTIPDAMLSGTVNSASVVGQVGAQKGLLRERERHQWLEDARRSGVFVAEL